LPVLDAGNPSRLLIAALIAAAFIPHETFASCDAKTGAWLQASDGSVCTADSGGYSGAGATSGTGALSSMGGGAINAPSAVTVLLSSNNRSGVYAAGPGSQVVLQQGATIGRTSGNSGSNLGLAAAGGASITVGGPLTITLPDGSGNHGVLVQDAASAITLNGTSQITMGGGGAYSPGLRAIGGTLIANGDVTVSTMGDSRSDAVVADTAGAVTLNGALNLSASGLQASGLKVKTAGTITYNGPATITVGGLNGSGIRTVTAGIVNAGASSTTTINVGSINGQGVSARDTGSQVNLAGAVTINVSGATQADTPAGNPEAYAAGLLADVGGAINATGALHVNTADATSYGALLIGDNATIAATGGGAINSGGAAIGFAPGTSQQARFDRFVITNTSGDLIRVDGTSGGALSLNDTTASAIEGRNLLSAVNGSTFTATASRSALSGAVSADASSALNVRLLESSRLTGSIAGARLAVDGTSQWTMTADSTLSGLELAGHIAAPASGQVFSPRTLTVAGDWAGQGGTMQLHGALGGSGSPTDRIVIDGGTASGHTTLQITNIGGLGAPTSGDGIRLVEAIHGATTTAQTSKDAFALDGGHVDAGAYRYQLHAADATGAGEDWYLRSTYRTDVPVFAALPAQLRQADMAMLGNLHRRMGDETGSDTGRRAWARAIYGDLDIRQTGDASPRSRGHVSGMQAGTDLLASGAWRAGVFFGLMDSRTNVDGDFGDADGRAGGTSLRSRHLGGYATWSGPDGVYADGVLQLGSHRYSARPDDDASSTVRATGVTGSLEAGKAFPVATGWRIEPQAQVIYQKSRFDDAQISGATVRQALEGRWTGRLGLRLKGEVATGAGRLQPYARVNLYRTSGGRDITRFTGPAWTTDVATDGGATTAELAAGFTLALSPAASAYGELGRLAAIGGASRINSSPQGSVGLRLRW
jgi:outer membrane autotransporter protein